MTATTEPAPEHNTGVAPPHATLPPTEPSPGRSSLIRRIARVSHRPAVIAAGSLAATLAVTGAVIAGVATSTSATSSAVPPPGSLDDAGHVGTVAGADLPLEADLAEPSAESDDTDPDDTSDDDHGDDRPSPSDAPEEAAIDPAWLDDVADRTTIPQRALEGYAHAQLAMEVEQPDCQVSWPTLAGIGWIESRHGTYAGGEIGPDGNTTVDIIGIPLDGGPRVAAIPDTDGGELDGDPVWDRAVGPMQFIPSTWARWGHDANGSGEADPHNIDDAALSAAHYLCAGGRDLTTTEDWWSAILSYNNSERYATDVLDAANRYAAAANG